MDTIARGLAVQANNSANNLLGSSSRVTSSRLRRWRKALARVRTGQGNATIACIGDSTTLGATSGTIAAGVRDGSYPTQLSKIFTSLNIPSGYQSIFSDMGRAASATTYDTRYSLGSWTFIGQAVAGGSYSMTASATTASPLAFSPVGNTDTCDIIYLTASGQGTFSAAVGAGAATNQSASGASGYGKLTITGTLGANTYNMNWVSGGSVSIAGFIAYNSAVKQINVINLGAAGFRVADLHSWQSYAAAMTAYGVDLAIVKIGINDWLNSVSVSSFTTTLQTLLSSLQGVCDVVLTIPLYSSTAPVDQTAYTAAMKSVATSLDIPLFDLNGRFGGYATANADGFMGSDGVHTSTYGYNDEAQFIASRLLSV